MIMYVVWAFDQYYPTGPGDLKGIFVSREEALEELERLKLKGGYDYYEMTKEVIEEVIIE